MVKLKIKKSIPGEPLHEKREKGNCGISMYCILKDLNSTKEASSYLKALFTGERNF